VGIIELERDGRPLFRYKYNYRRDPVTGRKKWDTKESRDRAVIEAFVAARTPVTTAQTDRITVHELLELWQRAHHPDHATGRTKAWQLRTRNDRRQQATLRIRPFLGRDRVVTITPQRVEEWIDWMLEPVKHADGSLAPRFGGRVANKALQDLKAAVRWGRGKGLVENVYIDDIPGIPADPPKPPPPYTPKEVAKIAESCEYLRDATLILVAAYSGLRWSELRGLKWGDVSDDYRTIHVQRSIDHDGTAKLPKNGKPRTTVLLGRGRTALQAYRDALPPRDPEAWVFPNANGKPLCLNWYQRRLYKIRETSGIHFDLHEMRDTYASLLIATDKITPEQLTLWLGHSSVTLTLRRYARLFEQRKAAIADAADELIESLA
jgi:integrase